MNPITSHSAPRRIIVDSREQRPYDFEGFTTVRRALPAGDYSLEGLETRFAVERKSLDDWVQTVLRARGRFSRELTRLQSYDWAAVVIEGSIADILAGNYRSDVAPEALLGITVSLMQAYTPVHIIFGGDRPHAAALVAELLKMGGERTWQ